MTSALFALANATAYFTVAGQGLITDPDTGNVSPTQEALEYRLFLKAVDVDPTLFPGVDFNGTVFDGYIVDPTDLDPRVGVGTQGTLSFGTASQVAFQVLKARMGYGDQGTLGANLTSSLGTRIRLLAEE